MSTKQNSLKREEKVSADITHNGMFPYLISSNFIEDDWCIGEKKEFGGERGTGSWRDDCDQRLHFCWELDWRIGNAHFSEEKLVLHLRV